MVSYKIAFAADLLGVPTTRLRYRIKQLPGPWAFREDQRLSWPELLALGVVGHYCDEWRADVALFQPCIDELVEICQSTLPELADQGVLFTPKDERIRLVPRPAEEHKEEGGEKSMHLDFEEILDGILARLFNDASALQTEKLRSAA